MMDRALYQRVQDWLSAHRDDMVRDIMRLVSIKSVATYDEPGYPFGAGCKAALDEMLAIGGEHGFQTHNYDDQIGALWLGEGEGTIGFFAHLDVVPEASGWIYPPYEPTLRDGFIIGRGADDNKGPAVGMMYVIRCLKELGVELRSGLKLYVGCDEEHGMRDAQWFAEHQVCPDLSIIPDCGFPVCYGEKGIIEAKIVADAALSGDVIALTGGVASNVVPDGAMMRVRASERALAAMERLPEGLSARVDGDEVLVEASGSSRHAAFPEGGVNAIHRLMRGVVAAGMLADGDAAGLAFLADVNDDWRGTALGIAMEDELSGPLTCVGSMAHLEDGRPVLHLNIRYCITAQAAELFAKMEAACVAHGCALRVHRESAPNHFPMEHPAVAALMGAYREATRDEVAQPYVMGGGTYARKLPNALGFGLGGLVKERCPFLPEGHGGAHGADEALNLDALVKGLAIMAIGIVEVDRVM